MMTNHRQGRKEKRREEGSIGSLTCCSGGRDEGRGSCMLEDRNHGVVQRCGAAVCRESGSNGSWKKRKGFSREGRERIVTEENRRGRGRKEKWNRREEEPERRILFPWSNCYRKLQSRIGLRAGERFFPLPPRADPMPSERLAEEDASPNPPCELSDDLRWNECKR